MPDQTITIGHVNESDRLGHELHHAAIHGNKKAVKRVLDQGIHADYPNNEGQSPMFCACYANNEKVVDYLLSSGANPNEKSDSGLTPVIVAGYVGNVKNLIKLLNAGGDLRVHDNQDRNTKDWAMLQANQKKRTEMLEFLHKARLHAMSGSGQDLLLKKASSNLIQKAHQRQNSFTKMIRNRIGQPSVHDNLEKMATSHHSLGFGKVYANSSQEAGFLSYIPLISESSLRQDGEAYNNGAFAVMESKLWENTEVTVKHFQKDIKFQDGIVDLLINEIEHIGKLRHPNILTLMGVCRTMDLDGLVMVYERIGQGSLYHYLHQKKEKLSVEAIKDLAIQICNAIIFIHLRGLVHCAITSHAVCIVNSNTFKLGNFEYMVENSKSELGKKNAVTTNTKENCVYNWLAPEVIYNLPPSYTSDMYSYCTVLWELFNGDIPWKNQTSEAIKAQYSKGTGLSLKGSAFKLFQTKIPEFFKTFMEYGLELDPNKRKLSFLQVKDLLQAAPEDAKVNSYLKTNFPNLDKAEPRFRVLAKQVMKPTSPQAASKQNKPKVQELVSSPEAASTSKDVADSDNEEEKQTAGQKEESRRTRRNSETESKKSSVSVKSKKDGKANDCNMSCSTNHYIWEDIQNLQGSIRKYAKPMMMFQTE